MSAHTPGPWVVDEKAYNSKQKIRQVGPLPKDKEHGLFMPVCRIVGDPRSSVQNEANARLIAAAPCLFAACKAAIAALSQPMTYPADISAAKKWLADAAAKAEGNQ